MRAFSLKSLVSANPQLHDLLTLQKRRFSEDSDPLYALLDRFSQARGGAVRFIAAGAGDGLHNDPLREFILRDDWRGVLVEPDPIAFRGLIRNYPARRFRNIRLVQAAVAADEDEGLLLFTVKLEALAPFAPEIRAQIRALASLDHDRLLAKLPAHGIGPEAVSGIEAQPVTIERLARQFFQDRHFNLLILDTEGYDDTILSALDLERVGPDAVIFPQEGSEARAAVTQKLVRAGYAVRPIGPVTFASLV